MMETISARDHQTFYLNVVINIGDPPRVALNMSREMPRPAPSCREAYGLLMSPDEARKLAIELIRTAKEVEIESENGYSTFGDEREMIR